MINNALTRIGTAAVVGFVALGSAGCSSAKAASAPSTTSTTSGATTAVAAYHGATVVVAGHGEVSGTPDTLTMSIGVRSSAASAQAALDQNNEEATTLERTLAAKGVIDSDMQTSGLSISPNYDKQGQITGYGVSNALTVTVTPLGVGGRRAGGIIDAAAAAVGNDITFDGVQLSIGDTSGYLRRAREAAVEQAIGHAKQLAEAAGMQLGVVRSISDTGSEVPEPEVFAGAAFADQAAAPIQAGSQQLSVDVSVTFALMR